LTVGQYFFFQNYCLSDISFDSELEYIWLLLILIIFLHDLNVVCLDFSNRQMKRTVLGWWIAIEGGNGSSWWFRR
jgi:hypothetical protein